MIARFAAGSLRVGCWDGGRRLETNVSRGCQELL